MTDPTTPENEVPLTTALAHASQRVPTARPSESAGEIRQRLIGGDRFDTVADIAVLDQERLVGMIRIEDLVAASDDTPVLAIMDTDPPLIDHGVDQETAASKAVLHEESSLGVVDADGRFLGLIPPHRMLGVLLAEHREDLARISGYLHQSAGARSASEERLLMRFWHRFPWLLVGLVAALAAAVIVAAFERGLSSHLELAFCIPGIVYIADAVGTQTETLVIRGLSVGVPVGRVMWRELVTGLALGVVLAALAYPAGHGLVRPSGSHRRVGQHLGRFGSGNRGGDDPPLAVLEARNGPGIRQRASRHRGPGPPIPDHLLLLRHPPRPLKEAGRRRGCAGPKPEYTPRTEWPR